MTGYCQNNEPKLKCNSSEKYVSVVDTGCTSCKEPNGVTELRVCAIGFVGIAKAGLRNIKSKAIRLFS